ncbi:MmyB family transcriptional regulator [Rhizobium leguminosarum]
MLAAGYAPMHLEEVPGHVSFEIDRALQRMLRQHEPFPAIVMGRYWNFLASNDAAPRFFGRFVNLASWPSPRNLLHLAFDPDGLRPFWRDLTKPPGVCCSVSGARPSKAYSMNQAARSYPS